MRKPSSAVQSIPSQVRHLLDIYLDRGETEAEVYCLLQQLNPASIFQITDNEPTPLLSILYLPTSSLTFASAYDQSSTNTANRYTHARSWKASRLVGMLNVEKKTVTFALIRPLNAFAHARKHHCPLLATSETSVGGIHCPKPMALRSEQHHQQ